MVIYDCVWSCKVHFGEYREIGKIRNIGKIDSKGKIGEIRNKENKGKIVIILYIELSFVSLYNFFALRSYARYVLVFPTIQIQTGKNYKTFGSQVQFLSCL